MTMEMNKVLGTIIAVALASAGILDILHNISRNLHLIHNDTRDVAEMFEDGVIVEEREYK